MPLNIPGGESNIANIVTAKNDVADISTMFDEADIKSIMEISNGVLQSWVPGREVNALTSITAGKSYYILTNNDLDVSEYFQVDGGIGSADQSLTADRILSGNEIRTLTFQDLLAFSTYAKNGVRLKCFDNTISAIATDLLLTPNEFYLIAADLINLDGPVKTTKSFEIPLTASATVGVIKQNGARLIHGYGSANLFIGIGAGNFTTSGGGTNIGIGGDVLRSITTPLEITALGFQALYSLITGDGNTVMGTYAGYYMTGGSNCTIIGRSAGSGPGVTNISNSVLIGQRAGYQGTFGDKINIGTNIATNTRAGEVLIKPTSAALNYLYANGLGNWGINNITPNVLSVLDIQSTTKGVIFPRMTTVEKLAIAVAAGDAGLEVYDTTLNQKSYWNGTTWINY